MNTVSSEKRKYEMKARAERQEATRAEDRRGGGEAARRGRIGKTTVADIAAAPACSGLTVYNHFPDDNAL